MERPEFKDEEDMILKKKRKVQEKMALKIEPYKHQIKAFEFVSDMFGIDEGGVSDDSELSSVWQEY